MREVNQEQIYDALEAIGITDGDGVLVHSAIQFLGAPVGGVGVYFEALKSIIGPMGTLVVPAFNFEFPNSQEFDPLATPSKGMGAFSEYIRQHPDLKRTLHPMQSVACNGKYAGDLAGRDTPSAFDDGSAYDRMLELTLSCCCLARTYNLYPCCITASSAPESHTATGKSLPDKSTPHPDGRTAPSSCTSALWKSTLN